MDNSIRYYICKYADYTDLPSILFTGATHGKETRSLDGTKFIVWSKEPIATGSISWMNGAEPRFDHDEIISEIQKPEWTIEEE